VCLLESVLREEVRIALPRTGHFTRLGKDHIHHYTSNPDETARTGVPHGFLTLNVQVFLRGIRLFITPTARPGEPIAPLKAHVPQLPQPEGAIHAPIPAIHEMPYRRARELLIANGWQPLRQHWSAASRPELQAGNGATFWEMGFNEIDAISPTGLAHCTFRFRDVYRKELVVVTAGEQDETLGYEACVWNWYFDNADSPTS
jgi:hypothetical protein